MPEIITRAEAKARGLKRYFTGKPCLNSHISERSVITKQCYECRREKYTETLEIQRRKNLDRYYERQKRKNPQHDEDKAERERINAIRADAISLGKQRYFTGKPCLRGHICERFTASKTCVKCGSLRAKKDFQKHCNDKAFRLRRSQANKKYRIYGPKNPKGEIQWLQKNKALLRGIRRIIHHPNRDHSSWLNGVQKR